MSDPLSALREFNMNKKEIVEEGNQIIFGKFAWPRDVKTNYLIHKAKKDGTGTKDYYTLECLLFFLKNIHLVHPDYCREAANANMPAVYRPDRKAVLAYLNGEVESSASIDKKAPLQNPTIKVI